MDTFDDVWPILTRRAQELEYVETFSQKNKNDVQYNSANDSIQFHSRATDQDHWRDIQRKHWKTAWDELCQTGELSPDRFLDITNVWRSAAAVPFLQKALDLPMDSDNKRILLPDDFSLEEDSTSGPFVVGKTYKRTDIHDEYGGKRQSGIAPCSEYPFVLIFTGERGEEFGYEDEFLDDGTFIYTGEGQEGDMTWDHGNRAIRDHKEEGRQLHLFENQDNGYVTYVGEYEYEDAKWEELPDKNGEMRDAIRFRLVPAGGREIDIGTDDPDELAEEELYEKAKQSVQGSGGSGGSSGGSGSSTTTTTTYSRSELPKRFARRVADGVCQGCGEPAPFIDKNGSPFLEVHHLYRRSDGGADDPDNVIAICPNCHRRVHHGQDGEEFNQELIEHVENRSLG